MHKSSCTLKELAELTKSRLVGDPDYVITGFADLESAKPTDISFLSNPRYVPTRYLKAMQHSSAGAIFVAPTVTLTEGKNYLIAEDPTYAFQLAIESLKPAQKFTEFEGIHPSAIIHPTARIGKDVAIGPHAVIDGNAVIGSRSTIGANCYIGPHVLLGEECIIHPNVTIREQCRIGNRVIIQPGAVIGGCGFGYATSQKGEHTKLNHIGNVVLEDDVEIGACATIDRARFTNTVIGRGTKIDNLVAIAHNVRLGANNIICGQSGIAGSTQTEDYVVVAGQSGIDGHLKIGKGVIVSARSGIAKSVFKPGKYGGSSGLSLMEHNRLSVMQRNLAKYIDQIKQLQKRLDKLEGK